MRRAMSSTPSTARRPGSANLKGMIEARDVGQSLRIVGRGAADRVVQVKTQTRRNWCKATRSVGQRRPGWHEHGQSHPDLLVSRGVALPQQISGGALVTAISPGSPAAVAGIPGRCLVTTHESSIKSVDELLKTVKIIAWF